jgi:hypothetical protein
MARQYAVDKAVEMQSFKSGRSNTAAVLQTTPGAAQAANKHKGLSFFEFHPPGFADTTCAGTSHSGATADAQTAIRKAVLADDLEPPASQSRQQRVRRSVRCNDSRQPGAHAPANASLPKRGQR